jgi:hypothetical protein
MVVANRDKESKEAYFVAMRRKKEGSEEVRPSVESPKVEGPRID